MATEHLTIATPLGESTAVVEGGKLSAFHLGRVSWRLERAGVREAAPRTRDPSEAAGRIAGALEAYFQGDLGALEAIEVAPEGTPFQRRVWEALRAIRVGTTSTYGELARAIGSPTASRAVGAANRENPVWIVIPCHRVIGASGQLTGYAGGLEVKRWLLQHEGALPRPML